jgi:hypothetical protein
MSFRTSSSIALLAAGLVACGGSGAVCKRVEEIFGECEGGETAEVCREESKDCTSEDIDKMEAYLDCWEEEDLGCDDDLTDDEFSPAATCAVEIQDMTEACRGFGT